MNALDKLISVFAPEAAYRRAQYRAAMQVTLAYDGAKSGRRTDGWVSGAGDVNTEVGAGLAALRNRSRDLLRNNPYACKAVNELVSNTVGTGIVPQAKTGSPELDKIIDAVKEGRADAGLLIHEGQLFYKSMGLNKILDLGEWWHEKTGLPLPMGGNVIRRDLGEELMLKVSKCLHKSIQYSMDNREDALAYAMQFARDMPTELADRFVAMWVNDLTLDYGERGRESVKRLLQEGFDKGIIPHQVEVEFVD